jgi:hypothetical protein
MAKTLITRDQILGALDLKHKEVDVPEWGGTVRISEVNAAARMELQMMILDDQQKPRTITEMTRIMVIGLLTICLVDEKGERLFTKEDIEALGKKNAVVIDRLFEVADQLNGVSALMSASAKKK